MLTTVLYTFASVMLISIASLVGAFTISMNAERLRAGLFMLVSLAVGALLGNAFIHLIPESFADTSEPLAVSLLMLGGILFFFLFEKLLHRHHHHGVGAEEPDTHPVGKMILVSDGLHNFIDGVIIAVSYLVSVPVGIAMTIAVILHEIPQEIGDFGVLLHAGYSRGRALMLNFLSALAAVLGAGVGLLLGGTVEGLIPWIVPLAAGGLIYIALSDLVPELHRTRGIGKSIAQVLAIVVGMGAVATLTAFAEDTHGHADEHAPIELHEEDNHGHAHEEEDHDEDRDH